MYERVYLDGADYVREVDGAEVERRRATAAARSALARLTRRG